MGVSSLHQEVLGVVLQTRQALEAGVYVFRALHIHIWVIGIEHLFSFILLRILHAIQNHLEAEPPRTNAKPDFIQHPHPTSSTTSTYTIKQTTK